MNEMGESGVSISKSPFKFLMTIRTKKKKLWHLWGKPFILNRLVANSSDIIECITQIERSLLGMQPVFHPDLTGFNTARESGGKTAFSGFPHK